MTHRFPNLNHCKFCIIVGPESIKRRVSEYDSIKTFYLIKGNDFTCISNAFVIMSKPEGIVPKCNYNNPRKYM